MSSVNKIIILGNVGKDPEVRSFPNGDAVCNVSIATTDKWKDKSTGEMKEATEWHRVVFMGRQAEIAGQYLAKGSSCYVEGSIRSRKYTDKDGVEKVSVEIRAERLQLLGSPNRDGGGQGNSQDNDSQRQQAQPQQRQQPQQQDNQRQPDRSSGQRSNPGNNQAQYRQQTDQNNDRKARPATGFDDMDDDIPF